MAPLFRGMTRPCRVDQARVGIINQNQINAANAGNCEFYVTVGLLRRASDGQLRGVLAHELAHEDLGHVAKAQVVGAGLGILAAGLQQLFPGAGGGGFLSTHPAIDDRIATIQRLP
jgi:Zn-dependent protease with chaperone function